MVFSSLIFLYGFFSLSLLAYALCRTQKAQNVVLLIFSLIFYAWGEPKYVLLLLFMSFASWLCALGVDKAETVGKKRLWVAVAAVIDIGLIGYFKYASLICSIFGDVPEFVQNILLPIGISFYTFQLLTYVVDVYRGDADVQKSYWNVLLYASLFHQCVAGPIVRYTTVEEDLRSRKHSLEKISSGIFRFAIGLGKKVLIANLLGSFCTSYRESAEPSVVFAWFYAISFALQIYFDFSAYSDMAIGMGRILGFRFLENFNYPFISKSITEFWRRWHISLGSWFRDYVYIPLGGNRVKPSRQIFNILVVWCLTGLWHGAAWTFMAWGLYFGMLLIIEKLFLKKHLEKLPAVFQHIYVLLFVLISFVLFNADSFKMAQSDLSLMFGLGGLPFISDDTVYNLSSYAVLLLVAFIGATPLTKKIAEKLKDKKFTFILEGIIVAVIIILSTAYLVDGSFNPFLYFRF